MDFPLIDPVAFYIGSLPVRWYALAYLAGFILGWRVALKLAGRLPDVPPTKDHIDDFLTWAILAVILGGRTGYVLFYNLPYYAEYPLEAFKIWQGGMSFHGGALGMILAMIIYAYVKKIYVLRLTDIICAVVPIGLFFGRIANFINAELYGRVTDSPLGMVFPGGGPDPRHPSQLYEAFSEGLLLFLILLVLVRCKALEAHPGLVSGAFLTGYGIFRFLVEYVREPDAHLGLIADYISMGQILSLPMILCGAGLMIFALKTCPPDPKHVAKSDH
jgi:phosphatidylglycerol:prolipoprotein diacylglycerol transferase